MHRDQKNETIKQQQKHNPTVGQTITIYNWRTGWSHMVTFSQSLSAVGKTHVMEGKMRHGDETTWANAMSATQERTGVGDENEKWWQWSDGNEHWWHPVAEESDGRLTSTKEKKMKQNDRTGDKKQTPHSNYSTPKHVRCRCSTQKIMPQQFRQKVSKLHELRLFIKVKSTKLHTKATWKSSAQQITPTQNHQHNCRVAAPHVPQAMCCY